MYKRDLTPRYINISDKEFDSKLEWCHNNRPILVEAKYEDIKNTFDDKNELFTLKVHVLYGYDLHFRVCKLVYEEDKEELGLDE